MTRNAGRTGSRMLYGAAGSCAVALAIAGVMLPGLPTTVFVLAASYCFSRSSPRFERWLREHPWLGPSLERFASAGGMPPAAKRAALTAMWTAVVLSSAVLLRVHWAAALGAIALGAAGTLSILYGVRTVPERPDLTWPVRGAATLSSSAGRRSSQSHTGRDECLRAGT